MDEKEYEALVEMFATDGWKMFINGSKELEKTFCEAAPTYADTNDKWQFARGQISQLRRIIGYEDYVIMTKEMESQDEDTV